MFFDRGLRGGISMVSHPYAKANNKGMKEHYDPQTKQSYIMLVDANNLYGWAMSQTLPTGGFKWVNRLKTDVQALTNGDECIKTLQEWEMDKKKLTK